MQQGEKRNLTDGIDIEDLNADYEAFIEKFKVKKTTDECYTPKEVYNEILSFVRENAGEKLVGKRIVRPFYPTGDYQKEDYTNAVVIDNPPFSIISKIVKFYTENNIPFFIFADARSPLTSLKHMDKDTDCTYIISATNIIYNNGAIVHTNFISNLFGSVRIWVEPTLRARIETALGVVSQKKRRNIYPDHVVTALGFSQFARYGCEMKIDKQSTQFIDTLYNNKDEKVKIYGGAVLLDDATTRMVAQMREVCDANKIRTQQEKEEKVRMEGVILM